jgi:hypothetical protein
MSRLYLCKSSLGYTRTGVQINASAWSRRGCVYSVADVSTEADEGVSRLCHRSNAIRSVVLHSIFSAERPLLIQLASNYMTNIERL